MIIAGALVLASIFLFGNPEKKRKPRASRRKDNRKSGRQEPTLEKAPEMEESAAEDRKEPGQGELAIEAVEPNPAKEPPTPDKPAGPPPEKIKSLFLLARDNHIINGAELLQAALKTGMEFGEMNIFHRIPEGVETAIFSMANAAKPGHFDRGSWNTFETSGVVLFMTLPGPAYALDTWDSMLATARRIAEILHAELQDDEHSPFTRQKEAQIREEMREYDRSRS
jgi:cell division protein ZipA